jgi:TRAP transporter TAXI family solute receptor
MKGKKIILFIASVFLVTALGALHSPACAAETEAWQPPKVIKVGLPSTAGTGYAAGVAMYSVIEKKTGVKFAPTVGAKPADRFLLLYKKMVDFDWMTGAEPFFALKGEEDFAAWPPQSYRVLWDGGGLDQGLATRADSGIRTWADLKGKKVAAYKTYPAVQVMMNGLLAYANLTWDDVVRVEVGGFASGQDAVVTGAVDAAVMSALSSKAFELASSIHGLYWLPMPNETAEDKAAWARFHEITPVYYPNRQTAVAGASADKPVDIWAYNYQVVCYDAADNNLIYWIVKQMAENYDAYKETHAFLKKWTLDHALASDYWFAPRHEGAIRYFKEIGRWTPKMEAKQQELLAKYPQTMTRP